MIDNLRGAARRVSNQLSTTRMRRDEDVEEEAEDEEGEEEAVGEEGEERREADKEKEEVRVERRGGDTR